MQKGFAPIIILVGILVIATIGGAFYLDRQAVPKPAQPQNPVATPQITPSQTPLKSDSNFVFRYGIGARNELDTFKKKFTKDMVSDPSITIDFYLSQDEMNKIYNKMQEINFFDYPDKFSVNVPSGEPVGNITPCSSYYFKVVSDSSTKELSWDDCITNKNEKADKLRELIVYIESIIESKIEYKQLPTPKAGYL